jgi:HEAT repeat protein
MICSCRINVVAVYTTVDVVHGVCMANSPPVAADATIPVELLEHVERGNMLIFVGGQLATVDSEPLINRLTNRLAARCQIPGSETYSFPELARIYRHECGLFELQRLVEETIVDAGDTPEETHHLLAGLTSCPLYLSTALDMRLERAFTERNRPHHLVVSKSDTAYIDNSQTTIIRLYGSFDARTTLVLTDDEHERFFDEDSPVLKKIVGELTSRTVLFIGYDLGEPYFRRLYRKVTAGLDAHARPGYAFVTNGVNPFDAIWCRENRIGLVRGETVSLLRTLTAALDRRKKEKEEKEKEERKKQREQLVNAASKAIDAEVVLSSQPYLKLDYFRPEQASLFFGRTEEIGRLAQLVSGHRLTLLYGASGVGKTSLILAGLKPLLEQADNPYQVLWLRALDDPGEVIKREVALLTRTVPVAAPASLADFLAVAVKDGDLRLVIVLDQFEEFFIRHSAGVRRLFIEELARLHDRIDLPVKVVLSLREDWLPWISELAELLPRVYDNSMRLLPLTRKQAEQSIIGPAAQVGIGYEDALVDRLLTDLPETAGETILPPQLQIVCYELCNDLASTQTLLTLANYEEVGGATGVLKRYLDTELEKRLTRGERAQARDLLRALVTSQGTKAVRTVDELALSLGVEQSELATLLGKLVEMRLLRALDRDAATVAYELAHEYLMHEIGQVDEETRRLKEFEELVAQEVSNWQRFGTLVAADRLARIAALGDELRLNSQAQEVLLRSALNTGSGVNYWAERMSNVEQRLSLLVTESNTTVAPVRERVATALGSQESAAAVEPLLRLALHDVDLDVRRAGQQGLVQLQGARATVLRSLRNAARSGSRAARRSAHEALATFPLGQLPLDLWAAAVTTRTQIGVGQAARWVRTTPAGRAVTSFAAILLVGIMSAYLVAFNTYHLASGNDDFLGEVIVVNQGSAALAWLPGVNRRVITTNIIKEDVEEELWQEKITGRFSGWWWQRSSANYDQWIAEAVATLEPVPQAQRLWFLGNQRAALAALQTALADEDEGVRREAATALGQLASMAPALFTPALVEALQTALADENQVVRWEAATALGQLASMAPALFTPALVEALQTALADEDEVVRSRAARALSQLASTAPAALQMVVVEALQTALADDEAYVRYEAATALGQLASMAPALFTPALVAALQTALADEDWYVRQAAAMALGQLASTAPSTRQTVVVEALQTALVNEDGDVRQTLATALGQLASTAPALFTPALVTALQTALADEDEGVRYEAARALGQLAGTAPAALQMVVVEDLQIALADEDGGVRSRAAMALGQLAGTAPAALQMVVVEDLQTALADEDGYVRSRAATALGQLASTAPSTRQAVVVAALQTALADEDGGVRAAAARALGQLASTAPALFTPALVTALQTALADPVSWDVRAAAATALGQLGSTAPAALQTLVVEALQTALADENADVRQTTATALGQMGSTAPAALQTLVVEDLQTALADDEAYVRSGAVTALGQLASTAPTALQTVVVEDLQTALADENVDVRQTAATVLGQLASTAPTALQMVVEALQIALANEDADVRQTAVTALGQLASTAPAALQMVVVQDLQTALADDMAYVRQAATNALAAYQLTAARATPNFASALLHDLVAPLDLLLRDQSSRAIFLAALKEPNQIPPLREQLVALAKSSTSIERYEAGRALNLLEIAELAHGAPQDEAAREKITAQLDSYTSSAFFGPSFSWAAREAMTWLEEQTAEKTTP